MKFNKVTKGVFVALSVTTLAACGGSSNDNDSITPDTGSNSGTNNNDTTWVADVFRPKEDFANRCEVVRTGSDPFTGEIYQDTAGSLDFEKMWLRSWNHESYLWFNEVDDANPADYETPQAYFNVLKSTATTDSGSLKDNFHFAQDTAEYRQRTQGGASSGYGIRWDFGSTTPPRQLSVVTIEPNSPAATAGFTRGDQIIEVNGEDFISGEDVDTINAGLFPAQDGETHTIKVKDDLGAEKTLTVTSGQ